MVKTGGRLSQVLLSQLTRILKIKKMTPICNLFIEHPSYSHKVTTKSKKLHHYAVVTIKMAIITCSISINRLCHLKTAELTAAIIVMPAHGNHVTTWLKKKRQCINFRLRHFAHL